ncbi:thiamine-phosphate kinase [Zavarzinia compransoris]|uniref:Thiamine-monophosphate kinase n=1 Tax=Zavarzinia compransoris TaxID=1264899 RepID=A0A317EBQ5_9PROT|nr:thiamine-phosphate kinase [Zavarzinia compransoris]PWR23714.1 thiamine-phosphate kinase [Zavarzinia compransoris]TDP47938.1 thiamine-phosphate kinase [Zavarzinia compransoris]
MNEFETIARLFLPLTRGEPGAFGLGDDAAVLSPRPGFDLVLTKDAIVAGVHFFPDDPPETIGAKLMRVNLSDLAAKGAVPRAFLLAAAFPPDAGPGWAPAFAAGIGADLEAFGGALIGGDTVSTRGPAFFSLTAIGEVPAGTMIRRRGARAGDLVCVSGTIGDAALHVARKLRGRAVRGEAHLAARYLKPEPRLALGQALRGIAHAACDISDGLVADLGHLCTQSGVRAVIEAGLVPLSPAAAASIAADPALVETVLTGGDDYELVFALPPEADVAALAAVTPVTVIGRFEPGQGVELRDPSGLPLQLTRTGWQHPVGRDEAGA